MPFTKCCAFCAWRLTKCCACHEFCTSRKKQVNTPITMEGPQTTAGLESHLEYFHPCWRGADGPLRWRGQWRRRPQLWLWGVEERKLWRWRCCGLRWIFFRHFVNLHAPLEALAVGLSAVVCAWSPVRPSIVIRVFTCFLTRRIRGRRSTSTL